jgi:MATE family multidrug resistance protein
VRGVVEELRHVGRLAVPITVGMLASFGLGLVDTLMVGPLGRDALAGVSLATNWYFACSVLGLGAMRAVDPIVSQAHGAGDHAAVGRALGNALALALVLVVPIGLLLAGTAWILPALGQAPELVGFATTFCAILALGLPGSFLFAALRQVLQGIGNVRPATLVLLGANVVNAALVWLFVYHLGWGPIGCAVATATCHTLCFIALALLVRRRLAAYVPGGLRAALRSVVEGGVRVVGRLLREGTPLGVQMGMEAWAFSAAGLMVGWLGTTSMAAHSITLTLASLAFMVPLGISGAASTRVGNLVGAGGPWVRAAVAAVVLGMGGMSVFAVLFAGVPTLVAGAWQPDPDVLALATRLLPIAGAFALFDGVQVVSFGVLRGAGDLRVPSLANLLGYWMFGLPLGAWLAFREGWGVVGIWTGLAAALATVAVLLVARIHHVARRGAVRVVLDASTA